MLLKHLIFFGKICKVSSCVSSNLLIWNPQVQRLQLVNHFQHSHSKLIVKTIFHAFITFIIAIQGYLYASNGSIGSLFDNLVLAAGIAHFIVPLVQMQGCRLNAASIKNFINGLIDFGERYHFTYYEHPSKLDLTLGKKLGICFTYAFYPSPL